MFYLTKKSIVHFFKLEVCLYIGYCNNFRYNSIFCDLCVPKNRATFSIVSCDTFWQFNLRLYSSAFCYFSIAHKVESMYVIFRHFSANWHYITGSCYIFAEMYVVKGLSYCQNPICFWFSSQLFITSFSWFWVIQVSVSWYHNFIRKSTSFDVIAQKRQ